MELICDGMHPPRRGRATFKLFGADRVILISDTMRAAGMEDGEYRRWDRPSPSGATRHPGRRHFGGSVTDLMGCLKTTVSFGSRRPRSGSEPARAIGIYSRCGSLDSGKRANVVLLDRDLNIRHVIFRGEVIS